MVPYEYSSDRSAYASARRRANIRTGGFLGIENKFVDYERTAIAVSDTIAGAEVDPATTNCLNAVAQGDGESQRDGRRYKMNSLHIRGEFQQDLSAAATVKPGQVYRLAIVIDKQTNGAQMNAEDCFKATAGGSGFDIYNFRNLQFSGRFLVLYDKMMTINPTAAAGDGAVNDTPAFKRTFNLNFKIPEAVSIVDTNGTTALVSVITDNSIHVLAWTSSNATAKIRYESRVRFVG